MATESEEFVKSAILTVKRSEDNLPAYRPSRGCLCAFIREACNRLEAADKKLVAYYNISGGRKMTDSFAEMQTKIEQLKKELEEKCNTCPHLPGAS